MPKRLHHRLKELRVKLGFRTLKPFLAFAERKGHTFTVRRYGAIERGESQPDLDEVVALSAVFGVTTDALLKGNDSTIVIGGLGDKGRKALLRIADEIRSLEQ